MGWNKKEKKIRELSGALKEKSQRKETNRWNMVLNINWKMDEKVVLKNKEKKRWVSKTSTFDAYRRSEKRQQLELQEDISFYLVSI